MKQRSSSVSPEVNFNLSDVIATLIVYSSWSCRASFYISLLFLSHALSACLQECTCTPWLRVKATTASASCSGRSQLPTVMFSKCSSAAVKDVTANWCKPMQGAEAERNKERKCSNMFVWPFRCTRLRRNRPSLSHPVSPFTSQVIFLPSIVVHSHS